MPQPPLLTKGETEAENTELQTSSPPQGKGILAVCAQEGPTEGGSVLTASLLTPSFLSLSPGPSQEAPDACLLPPPAPSAELVFPPLSLTTSCFFTGKQEGRRKRKSFQNLWLSLQFAFSFSPPLQAPISPVPEWRNLIHLCL